MANASVATYQRVYVWELPVRFYHWVNAICVVVLIATGYLIGNPQAIFYASEAYQQYWFGTVRFLHFVTAFVFFFTFLFRIYWGFVGNAFARWTNFIPFKRAQVEEIGEVLKVDVLQTKLRGDISMGHNSLAGFIYFLSFLAFLFQSATGFALYSSMSKAFLPADVPLDCAADGRRVPGPAMAPRHDVVLHPVRDCARLPGLLPRLH